MKNIYIVHSTSIDDLMAAAAIEHENAGFSPKYNHIFIREEDLPFGGFDIRDSGGILYLLNLPYPTKNIHAICARFEGEVRYIGNMQPMADRLEMMGDIPPNFAWLIEPDFAVCEIADFFGSHTSHVWEEAKESMARRVMGIGEYLASKFEMSEYPVRYLADFLTGRFKNEETARGYFEYLRGIPRTVKAHRKELNYGYRQQTYEHAQEGLERLIARGEYVRKEYQRPTKYTATMKLETDMTNGDKGVDLSLEFDPPNVPKESAPAGFFLAEAAAKYVQDVIEMAEKEVKE